MTSINYVALGPFTSSDDKTDAKWNPPGIVFQIALTGTFW